MKVDPALEEIRNKVLGGGGKGSGGSETISRMKKRRRTEELSTRYRNRIATFVRNMSQEPHVVKEYREAEARGSGFSFRTSPTGGELPRFRHSSVGKDGYLAVPMTDASASATQGTGFGAVFRERDQTKDIHIKAF